MNTPIIVNRCANGFLCSRPNVADSDGVMVFGDIEHDTNEATKFVAFISHATKDQVPPQPPMRLRPELVAVRNELAGAAAAAIDMPPEGSVAAPPTDDIPNLP